MKFELIERYYKTPEQVLIDDVAAVAKKMGRDSITGREYTRYGKFSYGGLRHRFKSWETVLRRAGLRATKLPGGRAAEKFLFENLAEVWTKLGHQPSYNDMKRPFSRYDGRSYARHYGTWMNALRKFVEYQNGGLPASTGAGIPVGNNEEENKPMNRGPRVVSQKLRFSVLLRDGFRCVACGRSPLTHPGLVLHCDHIQAWCRGGATVLNNLQTLCSECNQGKGDMQGMENVIS